MTVFPVLVVSLRWADCVFCVRVFVLGCVHVPCFHFGMNTFLYLLLFTIIFFVDVKSTTAWLLQWMLYADRIPYMPKDPLNQSSAAQTTEGGVCASPRINKCHYPVGKVPEGSFLIAERGSLFPFLMQSRLCLANSQLSGRILVWASYGFIFTLLGSECLGDIQAHCWKVITLDREGPVRSLRQRIVRHLSTSMMASEQDIEPEQTSVQTDLSLDATKRWAPKPRQQLSCRHKWHFGPCSCWIMTENPLPVCWRARSHYTTS